MIFCRYKEHFDKHSDYLEHQDEKTKNLKEKQEDQEKGDGKARDAALAATKRAPVSTVSRTAEQQKKKNTRITTSTNNNSNNSSAESKSVSHPGHEEKADQVASVTAKGRPLPPVGASRTDSPPKAARPSKTNAPATKRAPAALKENVVKKNPVKENPVKAYPDKDRILPVKAATPRHANVDKAAKKVDNAKGKKSTKSAAPDGK